MRKKLTSLLLVVVILAVGAIVIARVYPFAPKPCAKPITYSLGSFDDRFGITQAQFLGDVDQAVQIWEQPISKDLFQYSPNGTLKINLVYDYRQEATDKLKSLGLTIDDSKASYDALKARYDSSTSDYNSRKQKLDADTASFEQQKTAYELQVNYWNAQGGASGKIVDQLNSRHDQLTAFAANITQETDQVNTDVDNINAMVSTLNRLGSELNLNVSQYNSVGTSRGQEFEEGLYETDASGQKIEIYEFDSQNNLVRVLAHELGHALGLQHINTNPEAIMYYLNQGQNEKLTTDDILALKQLCGLQK